MLKAERSKDYLKIRGLFIRRHSVSEGASTVSVREHQAARIPYRFIVVVILLIVQKPDGADPVHRPLAPGLF